MLSLLTSGRNVRGRVVVALAGLSLFCCAAIPAGAQAATEIIALSGNPAPDGNGAFSAFPNPPALNASGQAAFFASLVGTSGDTSDNDGIFLGDGGAFTQIVRKGQDAPDGNGTFSFALGSPVLNASGQAAFFAFLTGTSGGTSDDQGIFLGNGGSLTQIARAGQDAPDGNVAFSDLGGPALNASGQAAFWASLTGTSGGASDSAGIFRADGGSLTQIARAGQAAPDGNGAFSNFGDPALNTSGQAAFWGFLTGTSGGTSDEIGIFRTDGGPLTQIARAGQDAPDGNGAFSSFGDIFSGFDNPALNASGQVAFFAYLTGTSGGASDAQGIFLGDGGAVTQIARAGQAAPDGNGAFFTFDIPAPALNASGQVAFRASLTGTSGGVFDSEGIFLGDGGALTQVARAGQPVPEGIGAFSSFSDPALDASGQAAFHAFLTGNIDGSLDEAIFLANGIDILQVAREGDALAGSTITSLSLSSSVGSSGNEESGINDAGQVAYQATLANGDQAIVRFTIPDIHWTATGSGDWTADANWTQSTEPNSFHDTFIDPATSLTVTAPTTNSTVASLTLGGGSGVATLRLAGATTGDLRALEPSSIESSGVLHLADGRTFSAPMLTNRGTIRGHGTVDAVVSNAGRIEAIDEELAFSRLVANNASSGLVTGRGGTLRFGDGLTNHGSLSLTGGVNDVFGDIENSATGAIVVSGGAAAVFYDDIVQNGVFRVSKVGSTTSVAVVIGAFSGSGGSTGGGDIFFEGDLRTGNSPAIVTYDNNIALGPGAVLEIELGGTEPGTQYDQFHVNGHLSLDGTLEVLLIDGFIPSAGQSFDILDWGSLAGEFSELALPTLPGRAWNTSHLYTSGVLSVVPEPSSVVLLALALPLVACRFRSTRMTLLALQKGIVMRCLFALFCVTLAAIEPAGAATLFFRAESIPGSIDRPGLEDDWLVASGFGISVSSAVVDDPLNPPALEVTPLRIEAPASTSSPHIFAAVIQQTRLDVVQLDIVDSSIDDGTAIAHWRIADAQIIRYESITEDVDGEARVTDQFDVAPLGSLTYGFESYTVAGALIGEAEFTWNLVTGEVTSEMHGNVSNFRFLTGSVDLSDLPPLSPSVDGDYNQNGTVDAADYTVWRDSLGSDTALPNDDTPGVGPDDYTRWKTNFGATSGPAGGANAAVPEPASVVLLVFGLTIFAATALRRPRTRSTR